MASWYQAVVQVLDKNGNVITSGPDASADLNISVVAPNIFNFSLTDIIPMCVEFINDPNVCRAKSVAIAKATCTKPKDRLSQGRMEHYPRICHTIMPVFGGVLTYSMTTADGTVLTAKSSAFNMDLKINIGVLLPESIQTADPNAIPVEAVYKSIFARKYFGAEYSRKQDDSTNRYMQNHHCGLLPLHLRVGGTMQNI